MRASDLDVRRTLVIVLIYVGVAAAWILASGAVVDRVAERVGIAPHIVEIGKGLAFVGVTGLVLHLVLRRWAHRLQSAARAEQAAADHMRRVEDMRSAFLSGVSHELRTPLTAIVGYSATIQQHRDRLTPARLEDLSERLVVNADRLRHLVDDLLEVDRLLHGIGQVRTQAVDVTQVVRRVVDATDLGGRPVQVRGEPVTASIDVPKVERMVQHLVDNAIRHTGPDVRVAVRVSSNGNGVSLEVEDDGDGLPDALIGRLFDPFVQDPAAARRPSPGIGIGLTLVARFAALHQGTVVAENLPRGGAQFTVTLPRCPGERDGDAVLAVGPSPAMQEPSPNGSG